MSVNLIEDGCRTTSLSYLGTNTFTQKRARTDSIETSPCSRIEVDEELRFLTKAVIWMTILAVGPLIMFHIISAIQPDFLLILITPR